MRLGAPSIVGELSSCSRTVRLQHQVTGSNVELVVGGSTIRLGRADWSDQRFPLPPGVAFPAGAVVRARQVLGPDASDPSKDGAVVHAVLPSLPPPIVEAPFVGCAALVVVHGLSPDATVVVRNGAGAVIGSQQAEGSRAEVTLAGAVAGGQTVHVTADACGTLSTADSPPAEAVGPIGAPLKPPTVSMKPFACQRILEVDGLRPGETLTLGRGDGTVVEYLASGVTMLARLDPALLPAESLVLHVEAARTCESLPSDPVKLTASAGPPPPPRISTPPCPGTPVIGLEDLVPSAQVRLRRGVEELAVFEAAETSGTFDLAGMTLTQGDHLVVEQALCGVWSAPSPVDSIVTVPDVGDRLAVVEPVADCATVVRVTGTAPGSLVSVLSRRAKGRIGHALATADAVDVEVSPPLDAGDTIEVVADGCGGGLAIADVVAVPDEVPTILRAMGGEQAVDIGSCRIGALIDVRVAGLWAGSAVAVEREVRVFVTDPLVEGHRVEVAARWCGRSTSGDGRDVERRPNVAFLRAGDRGIDVGAGHWHSGQVKAIEPLSGGRALVATTSAGLWLLQPGVAATSLSDTWPDTWMRCITRDPSTPGRWFAGTSSSLRVSVPTAVQPEVNWTLVARGGDMSAVHDALVLPGRGLLVAATSAGVRWNRLASLAGASTTRAPVDAGTFWSLAAGPGESVVAYGNSRVFVGTFNLATLVWDWVDTTFATPPGGDVRLGEVAANMGFGCLASSPADRNRVYLAVEDARDKTWFPVLRSEDGGRTWSIPSAEGIRHLKPIKAGEAPRPVIDMSFQAERNLVITAHPTQRDTVLIAGRRKGVLGSVDGARTWDDARWPDLSGTTQFHEDSMCLVFDRADLTGSTVWAGGDGGVFRSTDLGVSWNSIGNRDLPTLMFDGGNLPTWAHTLTANPADPDVLIAGLQDNGLVYRAGAASAWTSMVGGDGRRALFVAPDVGLVTVNDDPPAPRLATWDGTSITRGDQLVPADLQPDAFVPILRRVCHPAYRRTGDLMVAVASEDTTQTEQPTGRRIYGLFDNRSVDVKTRFRWELLATMPHDVTGLGSWDGRSIVVSTVGDPPPPMGAMTGHIYRVDSATGAVIPMTTTALAGRGAARWVDFLGAGSAVAVDDTGVVWSADLTMWKVAPFGAIGMGVTVSTEGWSLAVDRYPFPAVVYITRADGVFWCADLTGSSWRQATNLPARPLVNNAEIVVSGSRRVLHVGTWNWSAWAAELP